MSTSEPERIDWDAEVARIALIAPAADEAEWEAARERAREATALGAVREYGVPPRALDAVAHAKDTHAMRAVLAWAARKDRWCLVLSGPVGVGKSVAAAAYLHRVAREENSPGHASRRWHSAAQLARIGNFDEAAVERIARAPQLVIDDLGSEPVFASKGFVSFIGDILNERQAWYRPTIITTNLNGPDFAARYEERTAERIREGGVYQELTGPSLRRKAP